MTSRWTIPLAVRVRQTVEHLRGRLDRIAIGERAGAHTLAHRLAGDELVGDVDVSVVVGERECAQAVRVPKPGGRGGLTLGRAAGFPPAERS